MEIDSRASILARIRSAQTGVAPAKSRGPVFAPIADVMRRYLAESKANLTEVIPTRDAAESAEALRRVLATQAGVPIYGEDDPKIRALVYAVGATNVTWSSETAIAEPTEVAITLTEALIAQTGSLLTSSRRGGRGASAVPATHIVYATTDQLLPDLDTALRFAMEHGLAERCSYVGVISGSSRTADIEKILVQGAHGPRKLVVILEEHG